MGGYTVKPDAHNVEVCFTVLLEPRSDISTFRATRSSLCSLKTSQKIGIKLLNSEYPGNKHNQSLELYNTRTHT